MQKGAEQVDKDSYPLPVELSWCNVSCSVNSTGSAHTAKTVLHNSSGTFFPCEAVAIMGPSGAGNSLLVSPNCMLISVPRHFHSCSALLQYSTQHTLKRHFLHFIWQCES